MSELLVIMCGALFGGLVIACATIYLLIYLELEKYELLYQSVRDQRISFE
jgi:hypothetical protein